MNFPSGIITSHCWSLK